MDINNLSDELKAKFKKGGAVWWLVRLQAYYLLFWNWNIFNNIFL